MPRHRSHRACQRSLSRGVGAKYILLHTPAKSNCHRSKSGRITLIPIPIPAQSSPGPDDMPP